MTENNEGKRPRKKRTARQHSDRPAEKRRRGNKKRGWEEEGGSGGECMTETMNE